ncbi:uncharacterized protein LOC131309671 [Rhododendron vialii]|uniref:uncharacterized protein LOC131309671 n=1 Tax=Rhododendron vialii TaxID=182163 RepID=UPI00265F0C5D|nr:uncharacterized protein LOC131309671 [Rhododendron vialii]
MNKDDASNTINELFEKVTMFEQRNVLRDIQNEFNSLETKLEEASQKIAEMNEVGKDLIDILSEEIDWQDIKKENLRTKLKDDSSNTINELSEKVTLFEKKILDDLQHEMLIEFNFLENKVMYLSILILGQGFREDLERSEA